MGITDTGWQDDQTEVENAIRGIHQEHCASHPRERADFTSPAITGSARNAGAKRSGCVQIASYPHNSF